MYKIWQKWLFPDGNDCSYTCSYSLIQMYSVHLVCVCSFLSPCKVRLLRETYSSMTSLVVCGPWKTVAGDRNRITITTVTATSRSRDRKWRHRTRHNRALITQTYTRTTRVATLRSLGHMTVLTVALMLQCCVRLSVVCLWRYVLWLMWIGTVQVCWNYSRHSENTMNEPTQ